MSSNKPHIGSRISNTGNITRDVAGALGYEDTQLCTNCNSGLHRTEICKDLQKIGKNKVHPARDAPDTSGRDLDPVNLQAIRERNAREWDREEAEYKREQRVIEKTRQTLQKANQELLEGQLARAISDEIGEVGSVDSKRGEPHHRFHVTTNNSVRIDDDVQRTDTSNTEKPAKTSHD